MNLDLIALGEPLLEFYGQKSGPLKLVQLFERGWGGDTSNLTVAFARLGGNAGYITRIGDDDFGKSFIDLWKKEKIDTSNVKISKGEYTGIYFIAYNNGHEFTYYRKASAASRLSFKDINENYIAIAKIFHSSGISEAISRSCREAVLKTAKLAKSKGAIFSFDINYRPKLWPPEIATDYINKTIKLADIIFPSLEDLRLLYGLGKPEKLSRQILKKGPQIVVVKLGSEGCLITTKKASLKVSGFNVQAVDPTGAGDAFGGAILYGFLKNWDIEKMAVFANAVGALTSCGKGAVQPIPKKKEADAFIKKRIKTVRITEINVQD